jgi:pyruvate dehydrogenase E2 component (dihydrolipoamide acetyltransferase)
MGEFRMPSLGADMTEGKLVAWHVKPGDPVKRGDVIAVVGTDKADIEVEVYETGVVERLIAEPGDRLPVGAPIAWIRVTGETAPTPAAVPHVRASPAARKLARELGVDLAAVVGTGPDGAIERRDVEQAAAAPPAPAPPKPAPAPAAAMRRAIAAAMARSNREIPHYYLAARIDMTRALRWLEESNLRRTVAGRVLPAALLLKAVARALVEVPALNGFWVDDRFVPSGEVHLGIAVSVRGGGLMVPAIHAADRKSVEELMAALGDAITRARSGRLRSSDVTDSTITVTLLGDLGVETVFGVIYPPQVALVGFGKIVEQAWAEGGVLGVRPVVTATLAGDHRASDGLTGARFLETLARFLAKPEEL